MSRFNAVRNWFVDPFSSTGGGLALAGAALLGAALCCAGAEAKSLKEQWGEQAPEIIKHARLKGWQNIGVLKFRVQKGSRPLTASVGTLNLLIADKLEAALRIADRDADEPLGITYRASTTADQIPKASHLTPEGMKLLFAKTYRLANREGREPIDAFLTGVVLVSADLVDMEVFALAFGRDDTKLQKVVPPFTVPIDAGILPEIGESFQLRSALGAPGAGADDPIEAARRVRENVTKEFPLAGNAAAGFRIFYDGEPIDLRYDEGTGEAYVPEPREGQKVTFQLERGDRLPERLGVVVKVNGENTLYREKLPDLECKKWVLYPNTPPITISGFQKDLHTAEAFLTLSWEESKENEMYYGADVGMITVVVFRERDTETDSQFEGIPEDLRAILEESSNLPTAEDLQTRGLVVHGSEIGHEIQPVPKFNADPTPVMAATIRYYRP